MQDRKTESFKPLTISVENLPASMARQEEVNSYAAERASLLLGCYRTGEANDPETYVTAIMAVLARYPEQVITDVTHPATGLPKKKSWLPTVKEVFDACEEAVEFSVQHAARLKRIQEQMEARAREDRGEKPTMAQLKARFGETWGISPPVKVLTPDEKAGENAAAMEREQARVRAEYAHHGLTPPASKFALSVAARRLIAEQDEVRSDHREAS
jgi:hypothetical protein